MGNYLNPGNSGFEGIRNDVYVDKTGLISLIDAPAGKRKHECVIEVLEER